MQALNVNTRPTWYFLRLMLVFYALFFAVRLALLAIYGSDFADLSLGDSIYAMLKGAWFIDTSITLVFLGIPFLIAYLPFSWCVSQRYLRGVGWYTFAVFFLFVFIAIGDLLYFGIVHRHAGHELGAAIASSSGAMVAMIVSTYWLYLLVFMVVLYGASKLWALQCMPHQEVRHMHMGWLRLPFVAVMFLVILLGMRGGVDLKPIQPVFAYNEGSMASGHLTLNGVFSVMHGLEKSHMRSPHFMQETTAESMVKEIFFSQQDVFPDAKYPLMRQRTAKNTGASKPNVVVLLLESWDYDFIDITRELSGKTPYDVTPNYNALAKKGRLYTNFYANGQRSVDGISSLIAGIPAAPGAGYLGEGVEMNNIGWMGQIALKQGYQTSFLSGSHRASFYMDKVAPLAGFSEYYGAEDLSMHLHPHAPKSEWGGWDYDLLMQGHAVYAKAKQPFLSVMFSVSTHSPWTLPDEKWRKFKGKSNKEKFLNTIYYTDWVLGKFFEAMEASGLSENTIFILLADHASGNMAHPNIREQYHIPLLIIAPDLEQSVDTTLGSQVDLIPTIIDLAGWQSKYASMGTSLVENRENRSVFFIRDHMVGHIEGQEMLVHNMQRTVYFEGDVAKKEAVESKLKAQVQVLIESLLSNRLMDDSLVRNE